ncbi:MULTISPECIES: WcaF family extracellular polysaccharide biosynthesis acetyltransferase [unclassified Mucilaginibacter]|uniref:WcaF family extracellular polysaccharide biosynthesis acetyltransferase n=1 Tax=unclassified Mucilaginibacter TaxID=2617802 RepID=UPI002AC92855|nr:MULTISPECIES: WcaF family extracellular polysaccharide biosynthesis acetyltransferase [unclassified Mucilaginibacter]MEB0260623.1 WcaF family extracellular polysaccharide biosynthesis acetyltransferase [Mucilaginibacter sp. 10I4]MEB0277492.1 WcaF family extracellular polysaccharide biosynthesis acetyltransferase [Mucilaginibacter sp. 10B2]MEB0302730.1 WcaF family extracellular polysaccharide biosynthesis acetyltransferase [Mucilaginibacter sp. 5C4]WPX24878.1 WcaF family extracellular polysac
MQQTNLSVYNNHPYHPGGSSFKRLLWYYVNDLFFRSGWLPVSGVKVALLRLFGASVGKGVIIKPCVNIKYPWHLKIGNHSWVGEAVWIDSLTTVIIGNNVCISQGAVLQTGSHNYKKNTFNLTVKPIILADGVWIGCGAIVNQGITVASHAVLTSGSVATKDLENYTIYQGNPAIKVRSRSIE